MAVTRSLSTTYVKRSSDDETEYRLLSETNDIGVLRVMNDSRTAVFLGLGRNAHKHFQRTTVLCFGHWGTMRIADYHKSYVHLQGWGRISSSWL